MKRIFAVLLFLSLAPPAAAQTPSAPPQWIVDQAQSHIRFSATQMGAPFTGAFKSFSADIVFDPDNLADSRVTAVIDLASVDTQYGERDDSIRGADWFDTSRFPQATFVSSSFTKTDETSYIAHGALTLRDVSQNIDLPFTLSIDGKTAAMTASLPLNRLDFGVGQGKWAETSAVAAEVSVEIDLVATQP